MMIRCEHCGMLIENPDDIYTYQDRSFCEPCAGLMHAEDYSRPDVMGCVGPAWRTLETDEEKGSSKSAKE